MRILLTARSRYALTIVECLVALTILSVVFLAVTYTVVAGQAHVHESDVSLRAVRLGKDLMEEIIGRPYRDPGGQQNSATGDRATFDIGDYHGFAEAPGNVTDFMGDPYPEAEQQYGRAVTVESANEWLPDLNRSVNGVSVTVTVEGPRGQQWRFIRFIPEPAK